MDNWFVNKNEIISKTVNAAMAELESVVKDGKTANYWIDSTHNIFAFVNNNGNDDKWIEIHFELYDHNEDIVGDLIVTNTESATYDDLHNEVISIVKSYYRE